MMEISHFLCWIAYHAPTSLFLLICWSTRLIIPSNSSLLNILFSISHLVSLPDFTSLGTTKIVFSSFTKRPNVNLAHLNPDSTYVFPLKPFLLSINILNTYELTFLKLIILVKNFIDHHLAPRLNPLVSSI